VESPPVASFIGGFTWVGSRSGLSFPISWFSPFPRSSEFGRFLTGASKTLLPDGSGPRFDWAFGIYNVTHSAVVWAPCFAAVWLVARRPVLELLGSALHIAIDIFTHTGIFAIKFLWPLSSVHFDGIRRRRPGSWR
jgi:hypothetical protein